MKFKFLVCVGAVLAVVGACKTRMMNEDMGTDSEVTGTPAPKPSNKAHTLTCATSAKSKTASFGKFKNLEYKSSSEVNYFTKNWKSDVGLTKNAFDFGTKVNDRISYAAIDIRNVNGKPHYHYFANDRWTKMNENWSSTKTLAVFGTAHRFRQVSGGKVGANTNITGSNGSTRSFAELNKLVHLYSDNNAAQTFKKMSHPDLVTKFANNWIQTPNTETFTSGHGGTEYLTQPFDIADRANKANKISDLSSVPTHGSNSLSPLMMAEFVKRLGVNSRDEILMPRLHDYSKGSLTRDEAEKLPRSVKDEDLEIIFYGSTDDSISTDQWSGMSNDGYGIELYSLPALGGKTNANSKTNGKWRVFSKTGTGGSRGGEAAYAAYICLPEFDGGREIAFFFQVTDLAGAGHSPKSSRQLVTKEIVRTLVPGFAN